jgi:PEP-CTERM motif-containing protein
LTGVGGIKVTPTSLLNNTAIAAAGGFNYNIDFMWNGTDSTSFSHTQKLIDYAGTESLQLVTTSGSASLQMTFGGDTGSVEGVAVSTTIAPNTWYNVTLNFNTAGNSLVAGDISGIANLFVDGSLVSSAAATKGTYGDTLARPIGIGEFGYGHTTSIIGLQGDIYSASITLAPEPSTLALGLMGGIGVLGTVWNARRRKA